MQKCQSCSHSLIKSFSLGKQPIANGFLKKEDLKNEFFYKLDIGYCKSCTLVQLLEHPAPVKMFNENYPFFSSQSSYMKKHFLAEAEEIYNKYLNQNSFVVELGCNDGCFLQFFKDKKITHLGIDPSSNVANAAKQKKINVIDAFFDSSLASKIREDHSTANLIYAANVMCHIANISDIALGISKLLAKEGVLVFEDPYLGDILKLGSYDQIYDEHLYYFSATSVENIFKQFNLELIDLKHLDVHGGSMRYTLAHKGQYPVNNCVHETLEKEKKFTNNQSLKNFGDKIQRHRHEFITVLKNLKSKGFKIAGYGATSKSTTVLNYCGIDNSILDFITDTTPIKKNKLTPGTHIPIYGREHLDSHTVDYVILFAWNHKKEIFEKETKFKKNGGHWIWHTQ